MIVIDMRLNYRKSTHIIVNNISIPVQYCFTKDDISGQPPGNRKVWATINFRHPESKELIRLRVAEPQSILDAGYREIEHFIEREIDCYINHCDENEAYMSKQRMAQRNLQ